MAGVVPAIAVRWKCDSVKIFVISAGVREAQKVTLHYRFISSDTGRQAALQCWGSG